MKKILTFLLIIFVIGIGIGLIISKSSYSDGVRAGTLSKFSHKGFVFKTNEGELNEGGFSGSTGNMVPRIWYFSVDDDRTDVKEALNKALTSGQRISLQYEERYVKFFWTGDTKYFVTKVEFAK